MSLRAVAAGLALALLAGCASVPRADRDPHAFDLLGRVLVTYSGGAFSANLRWQHAAAQEEIWLMTPTGQTLAHIVDSAEGATLTSADRKTYRAGSVEALTQQALGWALPLSLLQYWVQGNPAPGFAPAALERGTGDRLVALTQNGWRVIMSYYPEGEQGGSVRRLDMTGGANEIRFVIDTWRSAKEQ
jgi:outer membrane lipoprotein LolB